VGCLIKLEHVRVEQEDPRLSVLAKRFSITAGREPRLPVTRNSYANRRASRLHSEKVTTAECGRRTKGSEQTCRPADNTTEEKTGQSLRLAALMAVFIYTWRTYSAALYVVAHASTETCLSPRCVICENCRTIISDSKRVPPCTERYNVSAAKLVYTFEI